MARILVIDDEESILYTFEVFLSAEGHEVLTARDYGEALARLSESEIDLVTPGSNQGWPCLEGASIATTGAAACLGGMRPALAIATRYVGERAAFGRHPSGSVSLPRPSVCVRVRRTAPFFHVVGPARRMSD